MMHVMWLLARCTESIARSICSAANLQIPLPKHRTAPTKQGRGPAGEAEAAPHQPGGEGT